MARMYLVLMVTMVAAGCTSGGGGGKAGKTTHTGPTCGASGGDAYGHVDQIVAAPEKWLPCSELKAHGYVMAGSIQQVIEDGQIKWTFELGLKEKRLRVVHRGPVPDTFKDTAELVASGKLVREGDTLELRTHDGEDGILAKCPSKYAAPQ